MLETLKSSRRIILMSEALKSSSIKTGRTKVDDLM